MTRFARSLYFDSRFDSYISIRWKSNHKLSFFFFSPNAFFGSRWYFIGGIFCSNIRENFCGTWNKTKYQRWSASDSRARYNNLTCSQKSPQDGVWKINKREIKELELSLRTKKKVASRFESLGAVLLQPLTGVNNFSETKITTFIWTKLFQL